MIERMCRIYGHFDGQVSAHELRAAALIQKHGGPDAQTRAMGPGWALGNNRLAIVDVANGEQPYDLDDRIKAVFNGEIYNHDELRARLEARGYRFPNRCDGSIIPALYAEYGPAFVEHLDGMYALAVFDLEEPMTLVLATDGVGMKPLYYHWRPETNELFFASEIPGLMSFRGIRPELWLPGVDAYLSTKAIFGERTMFRDIMVMPPSSTLVVRRGDSPRLIRRSTPAPRTRTDLDTAAAELHDLLARETERLATAEVPVATITSGGLDSSFVTALSKRALDQVHSFNIAYRGEWPSDERRYAREVADLHGTTYHQVEVDPAAFPDLLPDVVWHLGQPNADPITLSTYALFRAVHEAGFKVALTGDGADELFGGYDRLAAAAHAGGDWVTPYVDALAAIDRGTRWELYSDDYRAFLHEHGTTADAIDAGLRRGAGDRLAVLTDLEIGERLPAYHLRRVDHLSMAHAVEVRLPFCQPEVVTFSRTLAPELKIAGGRVKRTLYAAASGYLPHSVLHRPKQPFTLPIAAMLSRGHALYDFAADVLSPINLRSHGLFDAGAVEVLVKRQGEQPTAEGALAVWALMIFELWLHQYGVPAPGGVGTSRLEVAPC
ncbi:MAG TPA: asparagine synthase (glutamine-hydrolyzing) [Actinomycetota bacterium]|nr:asparagine synthase (glutamine-hydrolyzing) [Actinomycetota bacterium]